MTTETGTRITEVRTVGVPVVDQDRALAFYVDTLGFEKRHEFPLGEGKRWIEVAPTGATTTIALVPAYEGVPAGVETGIRFTTQDADADHADLRARGVDVDRGPALGGRATDVRVPRPGRKRPRDRRATLTDEERRPVRRAHLPP